MARDDLRLEHLARVIAADRRGEAFVSGDGGVHPIEPPPSGSLPAPVGDAHLARDETVPDAHGGGIEGEFHLPRGG